MDKIVSDKKGEIARLCKKYGVKRLDVLGTVLSVEPDVVPVRLISWSLLMTQTRIEKDGIPPNSC